MDDNDGCKVLTIAYMVHWVRQAKNIIHYYQLIQSNLSNVTFQGNIEIWSHKTGFSDMKCTEKGN